MIEGPRKLRGLYQSGRREKVTGLEPMDTRLGNAKRKTKQGKRSALGFDLKFGIAGTDFQRMRSRIR